MEILRKTIGFADISKFSLLLNSMDESNIIEHLSLFYEEIGEIIIKNNGDIIKYNADEMVFSFDDAKKAVDTSKQMIDYYNKKISKNNEKLIVGLATGDIYFGEVGHSKLRVNDIFGKTVNNAALQVNNAKNNIENLSYCEETTKFIK